MSKEAQLVRAELSKLEGELAAVHKQAQSSRTKAGPGKEAEVAVSGASMKQQNIDGTWAVCG